MQVQNYPQTPKQAAARLTFAAPSQNQGLNDRITFANLPGLYNNFEFQSRPAQALPEHKNTMPDRFLPRSDDTFDINATPIKKISPGAMPIIQGPRLLNRNVFETLYPSLTNSQVEVQEKNQTVSQGGFPDLTESQIISPEKPYRNTEPKLNLSD